MSEANEVGVEILEEGEDVPNIFVGRGSARAAGRFGVRIHALKEDWFTVEKNAGAIDANVAKADPVRQFGLIRSRAGGEIDLVEPGVSRRPEAESRCFDFEGCNAIGIGLQVSVDASLGDAHSYGSSCTCALHMDVAGDLVGIGWRKCGAMLEVHIVVVNEFGGDGDQGDIAREAAVVEPVVVDRGNVIDVPGGVDRDDDKVVAWMEGRGDFTIKGSKASLVIADALLIYPDKRFVVGRADVEKGARAGRGLKTEVALVPDDAFEPKQRRVLGVPVAGDFESGCGGEIVLGVVRAGIDVGVRVLRVSIVADTAVAIVERSIRRLIDEVMPIAIEGSDESMIDADQKSIQRLLGMDARYEGKGCK